MDQPYGGFPRRGFTVTDLDPALDLALDPDSNIKANRQSDTNPTAKRGNHKPDKSCLADHVSHVSHVSLNNETDTNTDRCYEWNNYSDKYWADEGDRPGGRNL
jgi:hypothetical protein